MYTDELETVGFFIRHGRLHRLIEQHVDFIWLDPTYSSVFDDIYKARMGGSPVKYEPRAPHLTGARELLQRAGSAPARPDIIQRLRKPGRNEPRACGSGKKSNSATGGSAGEMAS